MPRQRDSELQRNQKLRVLRLREILETRTDERNPLTLKQIMAALAAYDLISERKTLYDDFDKLDQSGFEVVREGKKYYHGDRNFELPELKLLVDAVQSSQLITEKKSRELIGKLSKLTSEAQAQQLKRHVYNLGRKTSNNRVYYSIDAIHDAINAGKKISFKYFDYDIKKERAYRRNSDVYVRTPVALCWNDDKYYLVTYHPKYIDRNPFANFRVDRMIEVDVLDEDADTYDKKTFKIEEHIKRSFGMFSGETTRAKLAFDESLVSVVLDHFGNDTRMTGVGGGRFATTVDVSSSPTFLAWMFQFGDKAEILEPESLRDEMRKLAGTVGKAYKANKK
jgi:predicted DNA-binding transcriptional regulator YafY